MEDLWGSLCLVLQPEHLSVAVCCYSCYTQAWLTHVHKECFLLFSVCVLYLGALDQPTITIPCLQKGLGQSKTCLLRMSVCVLYLCGGLADDATLHSCLVQSLGFEEGSPRLLAFGLVMGQRGGTVPNCGVSPHSHLIHGPCCHVCSCRHNKNQAYCSGHTCGTHKHTKGTKEEHRDQRSTFKGPSCDCVVLTLLDVRVKLPGQNHNVTLHLKTDNNVTRRQQQTHRMRRRRRRSSYIILGVKAERQVHGVGGDAAGGHSGRGQSCSTDTRRQQIFDLCWWEIRFG